MKVDRGHHSPSRADPTDARFEAMLSQLQAVLSELVAITDTAALNRLHPHIQATLHRVITLEKRARTHAPRPSLQLARYVPPESDAESLTPAESRLVNLLHAGLSNKEIATRLDKSVRTVKTQLTSIYRKYNVRSRTRLLATMMGSAE